VGKGAVSTGNGTTYISTTTLAQKNVHKVEEEANSRVERYLQFDIR